MLSWRRSRITLELELVPAADALFVDQDSG